MQETSPAVLGGTPFESFAITLDYIDCVHEAGNVLGLATARNAAGELAHRGERADGCHITLFRDPDPATSPPVSEETILHESAHCWQYFVKRAGTADGELTEYWVTEGFAGWYAAQLTETPGPDDFGWYRPWREGGALSNDGDLTNTALSGLFRARYQAVGFWSAYESLVGGPESLMEIYEALLLELESFPAYVPITESTSREATVDARSEAVLESLDSFAPFSLATTMAKAVADPGPMFGNGFAWPDAGASESETNWHLGAPGSWTDPADSLAVLGTGEVLVSALGQRNPGDVWELALFATDPFDIIVMVDTDEPAARTLNAGLNRFTYIEGAAAECPPDQILAPDAELPTQVPAGTDDYVILANPSAAMVGAIVNWRSATLAEWQAENCIVPAFDVVREFAHVQPLYNGPPVDLCGVDDPLDCPPVFSMTATRVGTHASGVEIGTQSGIATNAVSMSESQVEVTATSDSDVTLNPGIAFIRADALSERSTTLRVEAGADVRFSWDVCSSPGFPISAVAQVLQNGGLRLNANSSGSPEACSGSEVITFSAPAEVTLRAWARSSATAHLGTGIASHSVTASISARVEP